MKRDFMMLLKWILISERYNAQLESISGLSTSGRVLGTSRHNGAGDQSQNRDPPSGAENFDVLLRAFYCVIRIARRNAVIMGDATVNFPSRNETGFLRQSCSR